MSQSYAVEHLNFRKHSGQCKQLWGNAVCRSLYQNTTVNS